MSAPLYTSRQVAELAMRAAELGLSQMFADAGLDQSRLDSDEPSPVELWAAHFVDTELRRDYQVDAFLRRTDTSTALFEQQLEALLGRLYDRKYPALKARSFLPPSPSIPAGAETVSSIGYDMEGEATILSSYGEQVRRVELDGVKSTWNIIGIAASCAITLQQARAAAMAGVPLDSKGIAAARWLIEKKIDDLLATGDTSSGLDGFLNLTTGSSGVLIENKTGDLDGDWELAATAASTVINDFAVCYQNFESAAIFLPDTCLLPTNVWSRLMALQINTASSTTVLEFLSDKYGVAFDRWSKLDTADSVGTGGRIVLYQKSEDVISPIISVEPEILPSVWRGTSWETVLHARCGGVRVENPKGILYADHKV